MSLKAEDPTGSITLSSKTDPRNGEQKTAFLTTASLQMLRERTRCVHLSLHYWIPAALRCSNVDGRALHREVGC